MKANEKSRVALKAPFPYFGGKSRVAEEVWRRFGQIDRYIEPFAGSLAVLLAAPAPVKSEIVNDVDCLLTNFWRAVQVDPDEIARRSAQPINEADLHARHKWLVRAKPELRAMMEMCPDACDVRAAAWWVWGISQWLGAGWGERLARSKPKITNYEGVFAKSRRDRLPSVMRDMCDRLDQTRVMCGDWSRAVTGSIIKLPGRGVVGVLLDPPYSYAAGRHKGMYADDDGDVASKACQWAIEHGDDPELRIALCGYDGEHAMPQSWSVFQWSAGTVGMKKTGRNAVNRHRERIWFSPHCLK